MISLIIHHDSRVRENSEVVIKFTQMMCNNDETALHHDDYQLNKGETILIGL